MKIPKSLEFHNETNCVLSRFLKAAEPEEGCCILIGKTNSSAKDHKRNIWEVTHIWNCRNIWGEQESKLIDQNIKEFSNQKNIYKSYMFVKHLSKNKSNMQNKTTNLKNV